MVRLYTQLNLLKKKTKNNLHSIMVRLYTSIEFIKSNFYFLFTFHYG